MHTILFSKKMFVIFSLILMLFLPLPLIANPAVETNPPVVNGIISQVQVKTGSIVVDGQQYYFDPQHITVMNATLGAVLPETLHPGLIVSMTLDLTDNTMVKKIEISSDERFDVDN